MYYLNSCRVAALRSARFWKRLAATDMTITRYRNRSPCDLRPDDKPCFDITKVTVERGNPCHSNMIRLFLYNHFWPREPSVVGLWMNIDSPYLDILTDKYCNSGDRFLVFEKIDRTRESKLIGMSAAYKVFPWNIDELEDWAHYTYSKPDRTRMYFMAHCLKKADMFKKYHLEFVYDVEVIGTEAELARRGVGKLLLDVTLNHAQDLRYPAVQVIAVNHYAAKICEKCGMKLEWSLKYQDYVDRTGHQVFFPRRPHETVSVYSKVF